MTGFQPLAITVAMGLARTVSLLLLLCIALGAPAALEAAVACGTSGVCLCTNTNTIIDCSKGRLTAIPSGIPVTATKLDLSLNSITGINGTALIGLVNLQFIDLQYNSITVVTNTSFPSLPALDSIGLNNNLITAIANSSFVRLPNLEQLDIYNNRIVSINRDTFKGISKLTILKASFNSITSLPAGVFAEMPVLTTLQMNGNNISTIEGGAFSGSSGMTYLNLRGNSLSALTNDTFTGLSSIMYILLSNNKIQSIDTGAFSMLPTLFQLDLDNCQIKAIRAGIFSSQSNLQYLSLQSNQIASIENGTFAGMSALRLLNMSSNALMSIPVGLFRPLTSLEFFEGNIHNNLFTDIPPGTFKTDARLLSLCHPSCDSCFEFSSASCCNAICAQCLYQTPNSCIDCHNGYVLSSRMCVMSSTVDLASTTSSTRASTTSTTPASTTPVSTTLVSTTPVSTTLASTTLASTTLVSSASALSPSASISSVASVDSSSATYVLPSSSTSASAAPSTTLASASMSGSQASRTPPFINDNSGGGGGSMAIVIGAVAAVVLGACTCIVALVCWRRKVAKKRANRLEPMNEIHESRASLTINPMAFPMSDFKHKGSYANEDMDPTYERIAGARGSYVLPFSSKAIYEDIRKYSNYDAINPYSVKVLAQPSIRNHLILGKVVGQGAFGVVLQGTLARKHVPLYCMDLIAVSSDSDGMFVCAVKQLKNDADDKSKRDFAEEALLMASFSHPHVVRTVAVLNEALPLMLVTEFMKYGSLKDVLAASHAKQVEWNLREYLHVIVQIAKGMEYLQSIHFLHRDLAARNCLVTTGMIVKIGDFGLSKDIAERDYYRMRSKGKLPVKWMSPEAIHYRRFSHASDVWSFGVTMWEVLTGGQNPYSNMSVQELLAFIDSDQRLPCPAGCMDAPGIYAWMLRCWERDADLRPTFTECVFEMEKSLELPKVQSMSIREIPAL